MFQSNTDEICCINYIAGLYLYFSNHIIGFYLSGIPDNPELADTYYSQFENDFSGDESDSDEADETVIERTVKANKSPIKSVSNSKASSNLGTLVDDEDLLYNIMQDVLAKGDDAGQGTSLLMVLGYIDVISYIHITTDVLFDYSKIKKKIYMCKNNIETNFNIGKFLSTLKVNFKHTKFS